MSHQNGSQPGAVYFLLIGSLPIVAEMNPSATTLLYPAYYGAAHVNHTGHLIFLPVASLNLMGDHPFNAICRLDDTHPLARAYRDAAMKHRAALGGIIAPGG